MSSEIVHIEVDKKFIQKFFELAGAGVPKDMNANEFSNALSRISRKVTVSNEAIADMAEEVSDEKLKVLMIDNVGFIMQRIKLQLSKQDCIIDTFNDVSKAIEKIKKEPFNFIVLNILIPTEREGMMFLNEMKAVLAERKVKPKIIITGDSIRKELVTYLKEGGINHIIERKPDWITKLLEIIEQERDFLV